MDEQYEIHAVVPEAMNGTQARITELSALDDLFAATGTAVVKVTKRGEEHLLEVPIQSVDIEEVNLIVGAPPKIPTRATGGNPKFVPDPDDPQYVQKLQAHNRRFVMAMACMGLAVDIKDKQGEVVWRADNTVKHLDKAIEALRQMGLVYSQVFAITNAINDLTTFVQDAATQD